MKQSEPLLSVVIPAYNEEKNVPLIYAQLTKALKEVIAFEVLFVDDGSRDGTLSELHKLANTHKNVRVLSFTRNFGKEMAVTAGIANAVGDAIISVDADGQFPPKLIPKFIAKWKEGAQIVTGVRLSNQKEGFVKRYGSRVFYNMMRRLSGAKITPQGTDFRLIDKGVQAEFLRFTERGRINRGLLDWLGFEEAFIEFHAPPRMHGEATYSIPKLIRLAMNSFISLSLAPLFFSGYAGIIITPVAFVLGLFIIVEQLILGDPWHLNFTGTAMLGVALLFFVGIILISQGLIALYISHIHIETQNRPLYLIDRKKSVRLQQD